MVCSAMHNVRGHSRYQALAGRVDQLIIACASTQVSVSQQSGCSFITLGAACWRNEGCKMQSKASEEGAFVLQGLLSGALSRCAAAIPGVA